MMMHHQQKRLVKRTCHGHEDCHKKPTEDEKLAHSVTLAIQTWLQMDFCFVDTESDDDVLTILAMEEKPFQSVGATVLPEKSASEFAVATIIRYLDFW